MRAVSSGIKCLEPRTNVRTINEAVHLMRDRMLPLFAECCAGGKVIAAAPDVSGHHERSPVH